MDHAVPSTPPTPDPTRSETAPSWWPVLGMAALTAFTYVRPSRPAVPRSGQDANEGGNEAGSRPQGSAHEPGRGREAETPEAIPVAGWKDILWRVYEDLSSHRLLAVSAGVTFYALLAIFPAIAALVSLYGLFADPATIARQLDAMGGFMPGGAVEIIGEQVKRIASKPNGSLSLGLVTGLAVSLWSANAGMKAMCDALNVVNDETEKRGIVKLNALSLALTLGALAVLILAIAAVVVLPVVLNLIGLGAAAEWTLTLIRWPLLLAVMVGGLAALYRFGPSRDVVKWRWLTWGSVFAGLAWLAGSALFSFYVARFGNYNATYGSLGGAIGFMTWIWISTTIVLIGAELNAEMEHQTARDTTVGAAKPLGDRGAAMADQVGAAKA